MILKYVGPKPIISYTGIELDKNKEDKFVYLGVVTKLIQALDHKYIGYKCIKGDFLPYKLKLL